MAETLFGTDDVQTIKIWSKTTFYEALKNTTFKDLLGPVKQAVIGQLTELEKGAGDSIKYDLLMKPTGRGVEGENDLEDNEEQMIYQQDSLGVNFIRQAHSFTGMTQQRTLHDLRSDAQQNLSGWGTKIMNSDCMRQLCGDTSLTFANTPVAVDSSHYVICGAQAHGTVLATQEALMGTSDQIDLLDLDYAKERAKTATPMCEEALFDGQKMYVAILNPFSVTDIRISTTAATVKWQDIQQYANLRGLKNPIFSGALGVYNNIILLEDNDIYKSRTVGSGGIYRNLFLGKQAGVYAIANPYDQLDRKQVGKVWMSWAEQMRDYRRRKGIGVGLCFGIKACIFDGKSLGRMVMSAYGVAKG